MNLTLPAVLLYALLALPAPAGIAVSEVAVGQTLRGALLHGLNGPDQELAQFRGSRADHQCLGEFGAVPAAPRWPRWSGSPGTMRAGTLPSSAFPPTIFREQALAWLKQSNATISHYLDSQLQIEKMLGASRLPLTVLVDAQGKVLLKVYGAGNGMLGGVAGAGEPDVWGARPCINKVR